MAHQDAYHRFAKIAESSEVEIVSVDVFDTLLFRTTMPERVKFKLFGKTMQRLLPAVTPSDVRNPAKFLQSLRLLSAWIVYHQKPMVYGAREATLDEIYDCMFFAIQKHGKLSDEECKEAMTRLRSVERDLEVRDLTPNQRLIDILERARRNEKWVIAMSDMYLRYSDVEYILEEFGLNDRFHALYVSSEYGFGKASGALFDEVADNMKKVPGQICHIGDNRYSDYVVPVSRGVRAVYAPRSRWWRLAARIRRRLNA